MKGMVSMISASSERDIAASAGVVYRVIADYRQHHPHILPPSFSDFVVEKGGVGEGTEIRFATTTGGRTRRFHQRVEEPEPGRVLREVDVDGDLVTTFTVTPRGDGCRVRIETTWSGAGLRGMIERLVVPRMLKRVYDDELARLEAYVQDHPDIQAG
jgi:hypothetical protein